MVALGSRFFFFFLRGGRFSLPHPMDKPPDCNLRTTTVNFSHKLYVNVAIKTHNPLSCTCLTLLVNCKNGIAVLMNTLSLSLCMIQLEFACQLTSKCLRMQLEMHQTIRIQIGEVYIMASLAPSNKCSTTTGIINRFVNVCAWFL